MHLRPPSASTSVSKSFLAIILLSSSVAVADQPLPQTAALTVDQPLDEVMVAGIDRFALRALEQARADRQSHWKHDFSSVQAYQKSLAPYRERFRALIGAVDPRARAAGIEYIANTTRSSLVAENDRFSIHAVRWPVLEGVTAEGLYLKPRGEIVARVVAIPDADWTPEMISGLQKSGTISGLQECDTRFAADLAGMGCEVLVPTLIDRDSQYSRNESIGRTTNLTHREFVYRQAFELGRHIIGYEVNKVLAAVDQLELRNTRERKELPIAVIGVSEGGLLAMYSAAIDDRIDAAVVSGYFDQRESVWREPIYRNVWNLLTEFGDAEIASMIAPRVLYIEQSPAIPEVDGPPKTKGRNVAAPGTISQPNPKSVSIEIKKAESYWSRLNELSDSPVQALVTSPEESTGRSPLDFDTLRSVLQQLDIDVADEPAPSIIHAAPMFFGFSAADRQKRQLDELVDFTQRLLRFSHRERDQRFAAIDRSSLDKWVETADPIRQQVYAELFGKLPDPTIDPNPRSRKVLEEDGFTGYEVMLDVYPDVIAAGILLLPKGIQAGERRPVVVCQHGLEGTPMDTISGPDSKGFRAYKAFSAELANRGFIVYAPQNPYRGLDAFRTLQRKSNPLGRSLFSYIIPQHLVTLRWLSTLPQVDKDRIGFYGLSYGGKTAVRVPPMLPPTDNQPGYCLSICSADYNEWVSKNASVDAKFSYVWTGEYEIFEWNMGHVANYAELSMLMVPRPFMVERGHDDGVGIDEWVAWEYAKVRRQYNKLGIGDKTEIEFFDGPHTINGQGTYDFLHRHLRWPRR